MFETLRNTNSKVFLNLQHPSTKEAKRITRIANKQSKRVRDMHKPSPVTVIKFS